MSIKVGGSSFMKENSGFQSPIPCLNFLSEVAITTPIIASDVSQDIDIITSQAYLSQQ
jgi:hypothetical protein